MSNERHLIKMKRSCSLSQFVCLIIMIRLLSANCAKLPCHLFESINITDGTRLPNKSNIIFEGIVFPRRQYAVVSYVRENGDIKRVAPYIRGCLCNVKSCFRLCCSNELLDEASMDERCNEELTQLEGEVIEDSGKYINLVLDNKSIQFNNRTCKQFYVSEDFEIKTVNVFPMG